ncbi:energy transducer TonB [Qipengyuania gaetbuli]|uniref:TonB family protein n=1 Tax=Qipengyuania gaetbuli TaxID=266952 RepID=UPI001C9A0111|nr:TonB family protein [Qipengyuania gaetbuli]MBY6015351.1 energy transducer TonB [Qipengyuania gaetbuli]
MKFVTPLFVLAGLQLAAAPLSAAEPVVLQPASNWNLDYSKEACRLGSKFGEGENQVLLVMAKYAPGPNIEIIASGKLLYDKRVRSLHYSFGEGNEVEVERPLFGDLENGERVWQWSGSILPPDTQKALEDAEADTTAYRTAEENAATVADSFTMKLGSSKKVKLETGRLAAGKKAMDDCLTSLVKSWGYDPEAIATIVQEPEPVGRITQWFNTNDYPTEALRKDLSGAVRFRLDIDETGQITDCTIQSSYSDPAFPETVCKEFTRKGRFTPARNAAGEPVASYWANTVLFVSGS